MKAIYCIENKINGNRYVGSCVNFYNRKNLHINGLRKNDHHSPHLQAAWNKYGEINFVFIILEEVKNKEDLLYREQWWLDNSNSIYNVCRVAGSSLGVKRREETKNKVRLANLGLKHPDWRNEIKSKAQGGENHWTKKKKFSTESKKRMSDAHKKLHQQGYKHPTAKVVCEVDSNGTIIKEWASFSKCGKEFGVNNMTISNIVKGKKSRKLPDKIFKLKQEVKGRELLVEAGALPK